MGHEFPPPPPLSIPSASQAICPSVYDYGLQQTIAFHLKLSVFFLANFACF